MEKRKRSLAKAVTFRILAVIILAVVSYSFTANYKKMTLITVVYTLVQICMYFIHERVWDKVEWGKIKHPLSEINVTKKLSPEDRKEIEKKLTDLGYM